MTDKITLTLTLTPAQVDAIVAALWATNRSGGHHINFSTICTIEQQTPTPELTKEYMDRLVALVKDSDIISGDA